MHWKTKARIQNAISLLPSSASYAVYYWIQRNFGHLRRIEPIAELTAAIDIWKRIQEQDVNPLGKVFLEVGTGRVPLVPLAYWLMGAEKTITIDLNPYLKAELVTENLKYISENREEILTLFGSLIDENRFNELMAMSESSHLSMPALLDLCRVKYVAPGDAANTDYSDNFFDFHTSYTVFQHIPFDVLKQILEEGNRITKSDSLFVHRIDYSDHFAHSDTSISAINFLQFSDNEWERIAGNRYMYLNRLRHDDYLSLFESVGHHILEVQPYTDQRLQESMRQGNIELDKRFSVKSQDILAITGAWITSRKNV